MKIVDKQNTFNAGMITTKLLARDDLKQFNNGLSDAFNFICSKYGPIYKRVGTQYIWNLGNPGEPLFLLPFVFSVKQSLVLEFLAGKIRFYTFDGLTFGPIADPVNPAMPYELVTPFTAAELPHISYVQSLDVIYLAFPNNTRKPMELRRAANNNWSLVDTAFNDGPYLDKNFDQTKKVKVSVATIGTATITGTNVTFSIKDIGRHIRMNFVEATTFADRWCWGVITAVATEGATTCTVDMKQKAAVAATDTTEFRLGSWSLNTGYPSKVTVHEQRLTYAGTISKPWVWLSNSFAYSNFSPSDYNGNISDRNAIYYDASSDKVAEIFWIKSLKSLLIGTELNELRMFSSGPALSPGDAVISKESSYGSHDTEPVVTDDIIMFIQRLQRTLRAASYDYNKDAYLGPELSVLAESLTVGGLKKIVFQKEPNGVLWCLKEDGSLLSMTYDKDQDVIAWTRCALAGTDVTVVDMMVLPSASFGQDMLVLAVDRNINDIPVRYMELLTRDLLDTLGQEEVVYLDCASRFLAAKDGDGNPIPKSHITGLGYLEGETVAVTDQGAWLQETTVVDGAIDLEAEVVDAWIGLPYDAYFTTLERDFQDKQVSTRISKLRIHKLIVYVIRTLGLKVQQLKQGIETVLSTFDPQSITDKVPVALTEQVDMDVMTAWTSDTSLYKLKFTSTPGMPCCIAGISIGLEINVL